jgi:hypothetical protein
MADGAFLPDSDLEGLSGLDAAALGLAIVPLKTSRAEASPRRPQSNNAT